ncbi:hypothetical protein BI380_03090 [Delftia tsuruhatensis]|uniref:Uncharacterized protein n=1 Tax=Delftia tsuruhatensis TaxID=180282 RepID=A0ABN4SEW0_9BURK|nr:hypothetical protein BI380_03090 [Delftia tsuruhatensis]
MLQPPVGLDQVAGSAQLRTRGCLFAVREPRLFGEFLGSLVDAQIRITATVVPVVQLGEKDGSVDAAEESGQARVIGNRPSHLAQCC